MHPSTYAIHSWSGGKDSALALQAALNAHVPVTTLITAMDEAGQSSRSHAIPPELILAQAAALGLRAQFYRTSWANYEERFVATLKGHQAQGARWAVFGDIDLEPHREWEERVCAQSGLHPLLPLWQMGRQELAELFISQGYKAIVCCVNGDHLDESYVGREYDKAFLQSLPESVCPCGENGEFHTFVYDGPIFHHPVKVKRLDKMEYKTPEFLGKHTVYHYQLLDTVDTVRDLSKAKKQFNPHPV